MIYNTIDIVVEIKMSVKVLFSTHELVNPGIYIRGPACRQKIDHISKRI